VGLLTNWEIGEVVNHGALDERLTRSALMAVVRKRGSREELAILGLHLHARETFEDEAVRLKEIEAALEIAGKLRRPHVMAGDFNTSHPGQLIDPGKLAPKRRERICAQGDRLPRQVITRVLAAGYIDAHAIGRRAEEFDTSFTTSDPAMRVDFVFASPELGGQVRRCGVFKPEIARFASDHYPVVAEIDLG
jgi:endonuclease/exonuclease/phosphatase family metal-dependent hydrolase